MVIINADKVSVTGRKETDKTYFRHTNGRPGGWRVETLRDLRQVSGTDLLAVWAPIHSREVPGARGMPVREACSPA